MLTHAELLRLLRYDRRTGEWVWLVSRGKVKAGSIAGTFAEDGYRYIRINYIGYRAHILAWFYVKGHWPTEEIDHRNGKRADNRFTNLRPCKVNQQNKREAHRNNQLGVLGVSPSKNGKRFRAQIGVDGENIKLGTFDTAKEAHEAYVTAKRLVHEYCTI